MEMKVILRFQISGEHLDSGKTASNDEKIGGTISKYTILLISFFNSTSYDGNKAYKVQKMCDEKCDLWK